MINLNIYFIGHLYYGHVMSALLISVTEINKYESYNHTPNCSPSVIAYNFMSLPYISFFP